MKHISKKLWSVLLALALVLSIVPPMTMTALADGDTSYTLVIPSTLLIPSPAQTRGIYFWRCSSEPNS